jgi:hypothetical protein
MKNDIYNVFGWHMMAKDISTYTNSSFFDVMNTPANQVAGLAFLMHNHSIYNQYK